jgi:hypothetical protein
MAEWPGRGASSYHAHVFIHRIVHMYTLVGADRHASGPAGHVDRLGLPPAGAFFFCFFTRSGGRRRGGGGGVRGIGALGLILY